MSPSVVAVLHHTGKWPCSNFTAAVVARVTVGTCQNIIPKAYFSHEGNGPCVDSGTFRVLHPLSNLNLARKMEDKFCFHKFEDNIWQQASHSTSVCSCMQPWYPHGFLDISNYRSKWRQHHYLSICRGTWYRKGHDGQGGEDDCSDGYTHFNMQPSYKPLSRLTLWMLLHAVPWIRYTFHSNICLVQTHVEKNIFRIFSWEVLKYSRQQRFATILPLGSESFDLAIMYIE